MAEKGSSTRQEGSAKSTLSAKMFSYDVLSFTLPLCGVSRTKLRIREGKRNHYSNPDYIAMVNASVASASFYMRDEWKRKFESRRKSSGLDSMEKIKKYLSTIVKVLPELEAEDMEKIITSLALYSEMILFLNFHNVEIDFERLLDKWSSYYNETIALNKNTDELLGALLFKQDKIQEIQSLVRSFAQNVAYPYGKRDDVSTEYERVLYKMKVIEDDRDKIEKRVTEVKKRLTQILGFIPHTLLYPFPENVEEATILLTEILNRDPVLPGDRESPESKQTGKLFL